MRRCIPVVVLALIYLVASCILLNSKPATGSPRTQMSPEILGVVTPTITATLTLTPTMSVTPTMTITPTASVTPDLVATEEAAMKQTATAFVATKQAEQTMTAAAASPTVPPNLIETAVAGTLTAMAPTPTNTPTDTPTITPTPTPTPTPTVNCVGTLQALIPLATEAALELADCQNAIDTCWLLNEQLMEANKNLRATLEALWTPTPTPFYSYYWPLMANGK